MLGTTEWLIIFACVLLLFGADRLPRLARSIGEAFTGLKEGMNSKPESKLSESNKRSEDSKEA